MQKRTRNVKDEELKFKRRSLRRNNTKAECVLWQELRNKKVGYLFRRQVSIGRFIVDFYCHELRLIIEVDGPIHEEQKEYDTWRELHLRSQGYVVIRFLNDEVLFERETVLQCLEDCFYILESTRS